MMRQFTACLILAALLAGCDSPTQPASLGLTSTPPDLLKAHVGEVVREPISDVIQVPCIDEVLTLTGEVLHVFSGVGQGAPDNFTNFTDFFMISGTAVGESGTEYVLNVRDHITFESPSPEATQVSFIHKEDAQIISKDGGTNFIAFLTFHFTVLPDGSFNIRTDFDWGECRG